MPAGLEVLRLRGGIALGTHGGGATENVLGYRSVAKTLVLSIFLPLLQVRPLQPAQESCVCVWDCTGVMSVTNGEDVFLQQNFTDSKVISTLLVVPGPLWLNEDFGG